MHGIIFHRDDDAADAATGGYAVTRFEIANHLLPFFLLALLGHDEQQVKNGENKQHGQEHRAQAAAADLQ